MSETPPPFPGPLAAVWLTVGSWLLTGIVLGALVGPLGPVPALGLGLAVGLGVTGTLAARRVPPPQAERIGLQGFALRLLPAVLLLVPAVLLTSELDNVVRALLPPAAPPEVPADAARTMDELAFETALVMVGIAPVVEEFFFRGVLQQGLTALGGAWRGIAGAALLYALGHGNLVATPAAWLSTLLSGFLVGLLLGGLRHVSGSVAAPLLLSMTMQAVGFASLQLRDEFPIAGFNGPGDHTPIAWLAAAAGSVALGLWLLVRERGRMPAPKVRSGDLSPPWGD